MTGISLARAWILAGIMSLPLTTCRTPQHDPADGAAQPATTSRSKELSPMGKALVGLLAPQYGRPDLTGVYLTEACLSAPAANETLCLTSLKSSLVENDVAHALQVANALSRQGMSKTGIETIRLVDAAKRGDTKQAQDAISKLETPNALTQLLQSVAEGKTPAREASMVLTAGAAHSPSQEDALSVSVLALHLYPENVPAKMLNAQSRSALKYSNPQAMLENIPQDDPNFLSSQLLRAAILNDMGEQDAALSLLQDLAQQNPQMVEPVSLSGYVLLDRKDNAAAVSMFEMARQRIRPETERPEVVAQVYSGLGAAKERLGRFEEAKQHWDDALRLTPDSSGILNMYAYGLAIRNQSLDQAQHMAEKAAAATQMSNPQVLDTLAYVLIMQGKAQEALPLLDRAQRIAPQDPEITLHQGDAHAALGHMDNAYKSWQFAQQIAGDRDGPLLSEIQDRLDGKCATLQSSKAPFCPRFAAP